ncbi:hypothetical protein CCL45_gp44 [Sulfolobus islandicus rod-shaped virus 5]|uniref:Uncharacterized protein n=2 Tax=Usarudivirus SIRV5 TaxID=2846591 RepID=A0A1X9SKK9_9VIRU|nr:hypothetical protein CCL43_gp42 [Sulfolobus islandicus rod-shaped virus 7]YP_009362654.1 hypothetical protein CCL45_gp44 [Sulfolobus islandicus rod-shaped virus 5]YP_009362905.1 hypothetical protein CCL44_gp43 [Sulfolobus islandicus rod-shaped phage 6]ARQ96612.1 hypothetical protein [Sulfolobus islandicus rod-shaped virus 7]ARQ96666.1 hypothetical protein [Sulfolobus islandicus rod-shaped virus 5]ARQ96772.1 hypothetical protein [Sulfolobus islandicus rod-shaped phage 6]
MKIFTFAGYTKHLEELDFDYVVVDKTFNDLTQELEQKFKDKIIWNETNSDIRWIRIAKQLLKILDIAKEQDDDIFAIIDSDLIVPKIREINPQNRILTLCYWLYYDWANEIRPFCSGTNYIFRKNQISNLEIILNTYLEKEYYKEIPIDIFIHDHILHINILKLGTIHYVKTPEGEKKMEFKFEDIPQLFKHIPEFVSISW